MAAYRIFSGFNACYFQRYYWANTQRGSSGALLLTWRMLESKLAAENATPLQLASEASAFGTAHIDDGRRCYFRFADEGLAIIA